MPIVDLFKTAFLSLVIGGLSGTALYAIFGGLFYTALRKVERSSAETPTYPSLRAFYAQNTMYHIVLLVVCAAAFFAYSRAQ